MQQFTTAIAPGEIAGAQDDRARRFAPAAEQIIDARAVFSALWRRKWTVLLTAAATTLAAVVYVVSATPVFTAQAQVMLNTRQQNVADVDAVLSALSLTDTALESELEIIQSSQLLQRVIGKLRLDEDPEFNAALRPPDPLREALDWRAYAPLDLLRAYGLAPADPPVPDPVLEARREEIAVVNALRDSLSVSQEGFSSVFGIRVRSASPEKSALIANTVADQYIVDQLEAVFEATRRASGWLEERVAGLRADVEAAEARVAAFREERSIAEGQGADITRQQLLELNSRLIVARAERSEVEARFRQIERLGQSGDIATLPAVLASTLIQNLRQQEAAVQRRVAELSARYGPRHPEMVNANAELRDLRSGIRLEIDKIVQGLGNDLEVAQRREDALMASVRELEQRLLQQSETTTRLQQLEREAEAARTIYDNFLARLNETRQQENLPQADARVINAAVPPLRPSAPNKTLIVAVAGAGGLVLGLLLAGLREYLNDTVQSVAALERETGLTVLGTLPRVARAGTPGKALAYVRRKPRSQLAECLRNLRTSILLSRLDAPPRVIMVTSSTPGEGKSTTSMLLGQLSGQLGKTAIVVDCDLRQPSLWQVFDLKNAPGVTEVLAEKATLDEAIHRDPESSFDVLPAHRIAASAADVLASRRFSQLVEELRTRYDLVILDTPPALAVTDARIVGVLADAILYVVRWDATPREAVLEGVQQLRDVGVNVIGAVLTLVDFDRSKNRSQSGYGYYGDYRTYFNN